MKPTRFLVPVLGISLFSATAFAQRGPDVFFGAGTMMAPSSNTLIDTFGTGNPFTTPSLAGTFGKAGADFMITPYLGLGAETDFRLSQGAYTGLTYRPTFYDFNAIFAPTARRVKRVVPELEFGLGGVNLRYYSPSQSYCNPFTGCSSQNYLFDSSNHFQVHMAAGIRLYATGHLFVEPRVDARYVNNFFQFGSNWVPEFGGAVGWSFGEH
jgi:hypothetical protein